MEFGQLMADILVYVSSNFDIYIFDIAQVIGENVPIAFLYVLSIFSFFISLGYCTDLYITCPILQVIPFLLPLLTFALFINSD